MKTNILTKNFIQKRDLSNNLSKKYSKNYSTIIKKINQNLDNSKTSLNVLSNNYSFNFNFRELKRFKKYKTVNIIGMGGSTLGAQAIYEFFKKKTKKNFYFFDDINIDNIRKFKKKEKLSKSLFLVISKSGNTIETLSNLLSLKILKKNKKNIIIISEKKNNFLHSQAKKLNLFYIEHKNFIGGRFSVLSEVGLLPAYLMGINIFKIRRNIKKFLSNRREINYLRESSIKLADILIKKKKNNIIFLNYVPQLEKFLYWCQQLIAESLGKKGMGFLPVVSNVPKDHHSLLQLFLDGPRDKIFYVFNYEKTTSKKIKIKSNDKKLSHLNNKNIEAIKSAQTKALVETLKNNKISYRIFELKNIHEETLGELFSYFMLETVIIGNLVGINPFGQPAVEQVKVLTKKYLFESAK